MSIKTCRKIGFWTALAMMVGSIVGIGIFFKSDGILKANDWNGISTLMSWVVGGILSITAAISFSEIGSMKVGRVTSIGGWSESISGKKLGYFARFNYSFFYYGIWAMVMGTFCGEMVFKMLEIAGVYSKIGSSIPFYASVFLGLGFSVFFTTMNFFSTRASGIFQITTTILKWVPLVLVAAAGLIFATENLMPQNGYRNNNGFKLKYGHNAFSNGSLFSFTGMLAAVPAVLFAFDSFLNAANMRNKMKKPDQVPMVILVGIISTSILYFLIALAAILHGAGNVAGENVDGSGIFDQVFSKDVARGLGVFTYIFLTISTFGVTNGIIASGTEMFAQAVETNTIFGSKTFKKKIGLKKAQLLMIMLILLFWTLVIVIPPIALGSDALLDGVSNFPTVIFFGYYAFIIFLYLRKREKMQTKKINNILFKISAWTAVVGITFFIGYTILYEYFIAAIISPKDELSWGLMHQQVGAPPAFRWQGSIYMFVFAGMFFVLPLINKLLTQKFEDNDVYIDTFKPIKKQG